MAAMSRELAGLKAAELKATELKAAELKAARMAELEHDMRLAQGWHMY